MHNELIGIWIVCAAILISIVGLIYILWYTVKTDLSEDKTMPIDSSTADNIKKIIVKDKKSGCDYTECKKQDCNVKCTPEEKSLCRVPINVDASPNKMVKMLKVEDMPLHTMGFLQTAAPVDVDIIPKMPEHKPSKVEDTTPVKSKKTTKKKAVAIKAPKVKSTTVKSTPVKKQKVPTKASPSKTKGK